MSAALDRFFEHYYARRPVNATFTGVHTHDHELPDWSAAGLDRLAAEMRGLHADLLRHHPPPGPIGDSARDVNAIDAELARGFLEIQIAEIAGGHGVRGNPALWTGEAIFSVVGLMIRDFAPLDARMQAAAARLDAIPDFFGDARAAMDDRPVPAAWTARARRECEGALLLLTRGVDAWLASGPHSTPIATMLLAATTRAIGAFERFGEWLATRSIAAEAAVEAGEASACGAEFYDLLLTRGHFCTRPRGELLAEARHSFAEAKVRLEAMAREAAGSWAAVQEQLSADHPLPDDYLGTFGRVWEACRARAGEQDLVTWPDWPIRYVPYPEWTREAAPYLYYLFYRSPAPFDEYTTCDYVVAPLPADAERHLRAWNHGVIKLNHVVHHGAVGHHVQNWHAYHRSRSRVGKIAAVDCASRVGMFCAGTMAEGWACYATELMDEIGFLSQIERVSEQHSRLRFLARAIVDIELHQGTMQLRDAVHFYVAQVGMPADAAHAEAVKNSMFPGTAIMYWLGTQGILDLRERLRQRRGAGFSLRQFHDELLGWGSLPVPLVSRLMLEDAA